MRRLLYLVVAWVVALAVQTGARAGQDAGAPFSHDAWDRVVHAYVSEQGRVDYGGLRGDRGDLDRYVASVAKDSPDSSPELFPTDAHKLAYWINAYNALIVRRVVDNYPLDSIRDLGGLFSSVFKKTQTVGGTQLSYDEIEHQIIRKRFREPRIHFVLNCASKSCAPLRPRALTAENLEASLQDAAVHFLNDPRNVRIDPARGVVELSKYFDWFKKDFRQAARGTDGRRATVLDFVRRFLTSESRQRLDQREKWKIRFIAYDWSLNDAASRTE